MLAPVACDAVVGGAFQHDYPQGGAEGLGAVTLEPRRLAATALLGGSLPIAPVGQPVVPSRRAGRARAAV